MKKIILILILTPLILFSQGLPKKGTMDYLKIKDSLLISKLRFTYGYTSGYFLSVDADGYIIFIPVSQSDSARIAGTVADPNIVRTDKKNSINTTDTTGIFNIKSQSSVTVNYSISLNGSWEEGASSYWIDEGYLKYLDYVVYAAKIINGDTIYSYSGGNITTPPDTLRYEIEIDGSAYGSVYFITYLNWDKVSGANFYRVGVYRTWDNTRGIKDVIDTTFTDNGGGWTSVDAISPYVSKKISSGGYGIYAIGKHHIDTLEVEKLIGNLTIDSSRASHQADHAYDADSLSANIIHHAMQFQTTNSRTGTGMGVSNDPRWNGDFTPHALWNIHRGGLDSYSTNDDLFGEIVSHTPTNTDSTKATIGGSWIRTSDSGNTYSSKLWEVLRVQHSHYSSKVQMPLSLVSGKYAIWSNSKTQKLFLHDATIESHISGDAVIDTLAAYHGDKSLSDTTSGMYRYYIWNESTLPIKSAGNVIAPNVLNLYTYSDTLQVGDSLVVTLPSVSGYTFDHACFNYWVADSSGFGNMWLRKTISTVTWYSDHTGDSGARINYSLFYKPN